MNREEYVAEIEKQIGYCGCSELKDLFEMRKKAEALEAKCDFYRENVDLENPREEDFQTLVAYRDDVINLQITAREYYKNLREHVEDERVVLALHNLDGLTDKRISVSEMDELLRRRVDYIFVYHCAKCNQQIDVRAEEE